MLKAAAYPGADELLRIEHQRPYIATLCGDPEPVVVELRRDLTALHSVLTAETPSLWHEHLVHEPVESPATHNGLRPSWLRKWC